MTDMPNIVVMFLDDSGWGDFRPFARTAYPTPNVERLAAQGCCFTQFYVPQAICSASRASLLTGCNPERHRVFGALGPGARGLDPGIETMAELLKRTGYATACFGKWHIGDHPDTRPAARGFDESCGLMVSNDMWRHHPVSRAFEAPLPFWDNGQVAIADLQPEHQSLLTSWYTERAVDFIGRHAAKPFFLYIPHNMPHVPLACSPAFAGASGQGLYADVMMEIDDSLGRVMDALERAGICERTLIVFTSDNGPWLEYGDHAGRTPYREGKGTAFDGGIRSACVLSLPDGIPSGVTSSRAFSSIDILPTIARLAGADLPVNPIDGRDVWDWIAGSSDARNPHEYYPITTGRTLESVISSDGRWKLHLPHPYYTHPSPGHGGLPAPGRRVAIELSLYDLENDPFETVNVAAAHPAVLERLHALAQVHRDQRGESCNRPS